MRVMAGSRAPRANDPAPQRGGPVRAVRIVVAALLLAVSAGCGVSVQDDAQSLPSGALPPVGSTPSATPTSHETAIHFVSGRQLEAVDEAISDRSAEGVMAALAAGPPLERQAELRTLLLDPLDGVALLSITSQSPTGQLTVARSDAFGQLPPNDQVLLVGQMVLSMAEVGIDSVLITDAAGAPVPRVLPDGRVVDGPAVPTEYESLILE